MTGFQVRIGGHLRGHANTSLGRGATRVRSEPGRTMAITDFLKKQFIDVIHWTEDADGVLAYRYPMADFEIQYGAQRTVRESQMALFVDEGKIADVFTAGRPQPPTQPPPLLPNPKNSGN